jgi:hypothetical protein
LVKNTTARIRSSWPAESKVESLPRGQDAGDQSSGRDGVDQGDQANHQPGRRLQPSPLPVDPFASARRTNAITVDAMRK